MARILIVDDSRFASNSLRVMVESAGHEVVGLAASGKEAFQMFKTIEPELVLLDYLMSDKCGDAVLDQMLKHDSNAAVIMISGSGDHSLHERILEAGAKAFFEKPCAKEDLLKAIDRVTNA